MFAHVILKKDINTAVYKRADGTEFESVTSNYKHCSTLRDKLRTTVSDVHKIKDHTDPWGSTHIDACRIEDVTEEIYTSLLRNGRLTKEFVHQMTAADKIESAEDIKLSLIHI